MLKPGQLIKFIDDGSKGEVLQQYKNGNVKVRYDHQFFGERVAIFPSSMMEVR